MAEERIVRCNALYPVRPLGNVMEPPNRVAWYLPGPLSSLWASDSESDRGWRGISRIGWRPRQWWHVKSGNSPSPLTGRHGEEFERYLSTKVSAGIDGFVEIQAMKTPHFFPTDLQARSRTWPEVLSSDERRRHTLLWEMTVWGMQNRARRNDAPHLHCW